MRLPFWIAGVLALAAVAPLAAAPHVAKGLTVELVAAETVVVPGRTMHIGLRLKPDDGFHTYWRQPGLVGLTPTVEWSLPEGFSAGELRWPEPERGRMGAYGVWCLKREVALVAALDVPAGLDPGVTPEVTLKAKLVWMACSRTCHPGTADLSLTLPVRPRLEEGAAGAGAVLITRTLGEQPVCDARWSFGAEQHGEGGGFSLTITPPPGETVPVDAYFYGHQRLVDSNVEPVRHDLPGGAVRLDLALVEEPDAVPKILRGELWSRQGWGAEKSRRLLAVSAPLTVAGRAP